MGRFGGSHAIGEVTFAGVEQKTELRALPLIHFIKLFIGQQLFPCHFKLFQGQKMPFDTFHQLFCCVLCYVGKHHFGGFRSGIYDIADCAADQLFLEKQKEFPFLFLFIVIDQVAVDAVSELFSAVVIAD